MIDLRDPNSIDKAIELLNDDNNGWLAYVDDWLPELTAALRALQLERAKKNHLKTVLEDMGKRECCSSLECDNCVGMGWA